MSTTRDEAQPSRTARGYKIPDFCKREGVTPDTVRQWVKKGLVIQSSLGAPNGRGYGVRVRYADPDLDQ